MLLLCVCIIITSSFLRPLVGCCWAYATAVAWSPIISWPKLKRICITQFAIISAKAPVQRAGLIDRRFNWPTHPGFETLMVMAPLCLSLSLSLSRCPPVSFCGESLAPLLWLLPMGIEEGIRLRASVRRNLHDYLCLLCALALLALGGSVNGDSGLLGFRGTRRRRRRNREAPMPRKLMMMMMVVSSGCCRQYYVDGMRLALA